MTSKVNIILGLVVSTLLFITLPTTALAKTVSSGDALYANEFVSPKMMSLSPVSTLSTEDYGIATTNTVFPYSIPDGSKTVLYRPSYYTGVDTLSLELALINMSGHSLIGSADIFVGYINSLDISGITNGMNLISYDLWIKHGGVKYYLVDLYHWINITFDTPVIENTFSFGIDLNFAPIFSSPSGSMTANSNNNGGYNISDNYLTRDSGGYITVSWSGFEYELRVSGTSDYYWNSKNNADMNSWFDNLSQKLGWINSNVENWGNYIAQAIDNLNSSVIGKLEDVRLSLWNQIESLRVSLWNKIDEFRIQVFDNFTALFEKMDNEHEEIINGYDSSTNNEAAGQLNDSMTQAMEKEDAVNQQANGYVDGYTINGDGVVGYASQFLTVFPLVSSMMQSIFDSSGAFGIIFSVIFTMTIVCMFIGMFRWY